MTTTLGVLSLTYPTPTHGYNLDVKTEDGVWKANLDLIAAWTDAADSLRNNHSIFGHIFKVATTPTSQGAGAVAATVKANHSAGAGIVAGKVFISAADVVDYDVNAKAAPPVLAVGESCIAGHILCLAVGGATAEQFVVWGSKALTAAVVGPTDAQIRAALVAAGRPTSYIVLCKQQINRTGDATITSTYDNSWRAY